MLIYGCQSSDVLQPWQLWGVWSAESGAAIMIMIIILFSFGVSLLYLIYLDVHS